MGHVTHKIVSELTYNVSSGTLNSTIPYHTMLRIGVKVKRGYCHDNFLAQMPLSDMRRLSGDDTLIVPPTRLTTTVGDRAFPVVAARVRNGLSPDVMSAPSLPSFKRRLKTELFARSYPDSSGRV